MESPEASCSSMACAAASPESILQLSYVAGDYIAVAVQAEIAIHQSQHFPRAHELVAANTVVKPRARQVVRTAAHDPVDKTEFLMAGVIRRLMQTRDDIAAHG